jgi:hypothetical protein
MDAVKFVATLAVKAEEEGNTDLSTKLWELYRSVVDRPEDKPGLEMWLSVRLLQIIGEVRV